MNIREKAIIKNILSKDERTRSNQISSLFYGEGSDFREIRGEIRKKVLLCFSGRKYYGRDSEIYDTVVSLICESILRYGPKMIDTVTGSLKAYLAIMTYNCCNSNRKFIDDILGIKSASEEEVSDRNGKNGEESQDNKRDMDTPVENSTSPDWAVDMVQYYVDKIPHSYYREVLYALDISLMSFEDFAEEQGKTVAQIHTDHRRARIALIQGALPDIREKSKWLYLHNRELLPAKETAVLDNFFSGSMKKESEKQTAEAYIRLIKILHNEFEDDEKERRREERDRKRLEREAKLEAKRKRSKRLHQTDNTDE